MELTKEQPSTDDDFSIWVVLNPTTKQWSISGGRSDDNGEPITSSVELIAESSHIEVIVAEVLKQPHVLIDSAMSALLLSSHDSISLVDQLFLELLIYGPSSREDAWSHWALHHKGGSYISACVSTALHNPLDFGNDVERLSHRYNLSEQAVLRGMRIQSHSSAESIKLLDVDYWRDRVVHLYQTTDDYCCKLKALELLNPKQKAPAISD